MLNLYILYFFQNPSRHFSTVKYVINSYKAIYKYHYCRGLTSVTIPDGVTFIGRSAFYGCISMTSVIIPDGVTYIMDYAFDGCSGLSEVYCLAKEVPTTNSYAFNYSPIAQATLYVPLSSVDDYKAKEPWSSFGTIVGMTEDEVDGIKDLRGFENHKDSWYSLDGRKLTVPQKCINIKDGKKILVR